MWSLFKKIFRRLSGGGSDLEHSSLLPQDVDKLRTEFTASEDLDGPGGALSAREAFELAEEIIKSFDDEARLTRLESSGSLSSAGRAEGWSFVFLLPTRWGHGHFVFHNLPGEERVTLTLSPFAAAGSALDKMLQEGQLGFVEQQWKVEMERQPSLSHNFQDSSKVLATWKTQGKAVDFGSSAVLRAVTPPLGKARWELLESPSSKKSLYTLPIE
jgi:hypothetical protein